MHSKADKDLYVCMVIYMTAVHSILLHLDFIHMVQAALIFYICMCACNATEVRFLSNLFIMNLGLSSVILSTPDICLAFIVCSLSFCCCCSFFSCEIIYILVVSHYKVMHPSINPLYHSSIHPF